MKLKEPFSLKPDYSDSPIGSPVDPSVGIDVRLPDVSGLQCLPASGEITFRFTRKQLELNGSDDLAARICLEAILDIECDEEEEPLQDVVDKLFEEVSKESPAEEIES